MVPAGEPKRPAGDAVNESARISHPGPRTFTSGGEVVFIVAVIIMLGVGALIWSSARSKSLIEQRAEADGYEIPETKHRPSSAKATGHGAL
jgi:hypothetical protein